MQIPDQVKHAGDTAFFGGGAIAVLVKLTPVLTFVTLAATAVWAVFRIYEMWLSIKIKRKQLK